MRLLTSFCVEEIGELNDLLSNTYLNPITETPTWLLATPSKKKINVYAFLLFAQHASQSAIVVASTLGLPIAA